MKAKMSFSNKIRIFFYYPNIRDKIYNLILWVTFWWILYLGFQLMKIYYKLSNPDNSDTTKEED